CANITLSNIAVPAGETLDLTKLKAGTNVMFEGTTTFGYKEWTGPLISAAGSISIHGAAGHVIDGDGARWWDGKGGNGGKKKPKFFFAHGMKNAKIVGLHIKNSPVQTFSIDNSDTLSINHITIDGAAGDTQGGHNTDGFDIGSSANIYISRSTIHNQDDCVAINSGNNIHVSGLNCTGGHGISIGSVGGRKNNVVDGVTVTSCIIINSVNGVRVKTIAGATGSVSNVSYANIKLEQITGNGIVIEQDYENGSPTGKPTPGVPITNLMLTGVSGTLSSKATVAKIVCAKCEDWTLTAIDIQGAKSKKCIGVPAVAADLC
ncbi:Polygalacturonase, partial [Irineochytrium annulatum]